MLKLESLEYESNPTPSQIANALTVVHKFLNRMVGGILAEGDATSAEQKIVLILNSATGLQQAADIFAGSSNLALPQVGRGPMAVPGNGPGVRG